MNHIVPGFESLPNIQDVKERNATRLRLMDQARKLSLHAKAVSPEMNDEPGGKLDKAIDEISAIYHKWTADKGTQLVFLDRGVPKSKTDLTILKEYDALKARERAAVTAGDEEAFQDIADLLNKFDPNEMDELRAAQKGGWSAYPLCTRSDLPAVGQLLPAYSRPHMATAAPEGQVVRTSRALRG